VLFRESVKVAISVCHQAQIPAAKATGYVKRKKVDYVSDMIVSPWQLFNTSFDGIASKTYP